MFALAKECECAPTLNPFSLLWRAPTPKTTTSQTTASPSRGHPSPAAPPKDVGEESGSSSSSGGGGGGGGGSAVQWCLARVAVAFGQAHAPLFRLEGPFVHPTAEAICR